jgi:alpha-tubulin suppressor-like RCC1 family protein
LLRGIGVAARAWRATTMLRAILVGSALVGSTLFAQSGVGLVRHAPAVGGLVTGSLQVLSGENLTVSTGAIVSGDLWVPGIPAINVSALPVYGGTQEGTGSALPTGYTVTLKSGSIVGHIITRTDPRVLAPISAPTAPTGTRSVTLTTFASDSGDFSTLLNLTLKSALGQRAIPPGNYGNFSAESASGFKLGIPGATAPAVYNFQSLTLSATSQIEVVGPVIINLASGMAKWGIAGSSAHPEWLSINLYAGNFMVVAGSLFYGSLNASAPGSLVTINGGSEFVGKLISDQLVLKLGGILRLVDDHTNAPPTITLTSPANNAVFAAPASVTLTAVAEDADGTIAGVEFFNAAMSLGEVLAPPYQLVTSALAPGHYEFTAQAKDNEGAITTSASVAVLVNSPPAVVLSSSAVSPSPLAAPTTIPLLAAATDADGTVTKVEFYRDGVLIDTETTPTPGANGYTFLDTIEHPGSYNYTARSYDNDAGFKDSEVLQIRVVAALPYRADFESIEGYTAGPLENQQGWNTTQGVVSVVSEPTVSGAQRVDLLPSISRAEVVQKFAPLTDHSIVYVDFFARPAADADVNASSTFILEGARFALVESAAGGRLQGYDGTGDGSGHWRSTAFATGLNVDHQTESWVRFTARLNFAQHRWDLYAGGSMVAADLGFISNSSQAFTSLTLRGHATINSSFDDLFAGAENPLFPDANNNGIDDAWETVHGLPLSSDNRDLSPTGNGITVIQAYVGGTDPNDFYNGSTPGLEIVDGNNQKAAAGQFNLAPLTVAVKSAGGAVLRGAPVTFTVESGDGRLTAGGPTDPALFSSIRLVTDADGRAKIYFQQPPRALRSSSIAVSAGLARTVFVSTSSAAEILVAGGDVSLWQDGNGRLCLWGENKFGQLGDGTTSPRFQMKRILGTPGPIVSAALSGRHSLVVTESGDVYAWGDNDAGQLGIAEPAVILTPQSVAGLSGVVGVAAGDSHSLALCNDGTVWSWGGNETGQLGDGTTTSHFAPEKIAGLPAVVGIAAGGHHSMAWTAEGTVWVWGSNAFGQLSDDHVEQRLLPTPVQGLPPIADVVAGRQHILARGRDGSVWSWGANQSGQLGLGDSAGRTMPRQILGISGAGVLFAGRAQSGVMVGHSLLEGGANESGQLGNGTTEASNVPVPIMAADIVRVAFGWDHVVALGSDGILRAWGSNAVGQLGASSPATFSSAPVVVAPLEDEL